MKELTNGDKQRLIRERIVDKEILWNQSSLIENELAQEGGEMLIDELINYYDEDDNPKEVLEWWLVDPWLSRKLREKGEATLETDFGNYWGRCTSGQPIEIDSVIEEIAEDIGLFNQD